MPLIWVLPYTDYLGHVVGGTPYLKGLNESPGMLVSERHPQWQWRDAGCTFVTYSKRLGK